LSSRPIRWLAYLAGWTLFALFFRSEDAGRLLYQGQTVPWHAYLVVWLTRLAQALVPPAYLLSLERSQLCSLSVKSRRSRSATSFRTKRQLHIVSRWI
jgi:hypothetical protein